jgi:hypothetical protein
VENVIETLHRLGMSSPSRTKVEALSRSRLHDLIDDLKNLNKRYLGKMTKQEAKDRIARQFG